MAFQWESGGDIQTGVCVSVGVVVGVGVGGGGAGKVLSCVRLAAAIAKAAKHF